MRLTLGIMGIVYGMFLSYINVVPIWLGSIMITTGVFIICRAENRINQIENGLTELGKIITLLEKWNSAIFKQGDNKNDRSDD